MAFIPASRRQLTTLSSVATDDHVVLWNNGVGWQNPFETLDVNHDGFVSPLDALIVVNLLNAGLPSGLTAEVPGFAEAAYVDANGDNVLSALDALLVINSLA